MPRLLVVEDEAPILAGLQALFARHGFDVDAARTGEAALEKIAAGGHDLIVLDLMLPGVGGMEVLARLRAQGGVTPVLVLTARGAEREVVAGLDGGADDYVTKPFSTHELLARVRALLARRVRAAEAPRRIDVGGAAIDLDALAVTWPEGRVALTAREGELIGFLVARRHRAVTREELLLEVWGYRAAVPTRTVDVHVKELRAKLRRVPGGEGWIATVRGVGYRFEAPVG
jgi:two-component system response regulator RegX3